jgi:polysaccharide biosynthesis protein PslJ
MVATVRPSEAASPRTVMADGPVDSQSQERTPWLFAFLCLLIPILPSYFVIAGPLKSNGSPARIIAFIFFGLLILGFAFNRRYAEMRTVRPGILLILTYLLLSLLVYGVGASHLDSALAEPGKSRAMLIVIANVAVALFAMTRVDTTRHRSLILGCLAIGLTFNCAVALLQVSAHIDVHSFLQPPGFADNQTDNGRGFAAALTDRFGAERAFGTSGHPIEFAVLAGVTVPLNLHFARYATNKQIRVLAALAAGVALIAIPTAVSRSGLIALAVALLLYMWTFTLRGLCVALAAAAVAVFANFIVGADSAQALWRTVTNSAQDDSVMSRISVYAKVSQTLHDHPAFGLGLGANPPSEYGFLDNEWMQSLVQGGILGLIGICILAIGGIFAIAAALRGTNTPRERDQTYVIGAMFMGILASSYTFDLFSFQQATLVFFILFGLLWSNCVISVQESQPPKRAGYPPGSAPDCNAAAATHLEVRTSTASKSTRS